MRIARKSASNLDAVALLDLAVDGAFQAEHADAIDVGLRAMDPAAAHGDLVFAGQIGELAIVGHVPVDIVQDRCAVDNLVLVDPGNGATDDVAGIVAASAGGGHADLIQALKDFRKILDLEPVILKGLPRGDIAEAMAEIVGDAGHYGQLRRGELSAGNLGAEHEKAAVLGALAIDAVPLEAVEIVLGNGLETGLGVAINIVDDVEAILDRFELFLGRVAGTEIAGCRKNLHEPFTLHGLWTWRNGERIDNTHA